jgi:hypothetical protein
MAEKKEALPFMGKHTFAYQRRHQLIRRPILCQASFVTCLKANKVKACEVVGGTGYNRFYFQLKDDDEKKLYQEIPREHDIHFDDQGRVIGQPLLIAELKRRFKQIEEFVCLLRFTNE